MPSITPIKTTLSENAITKKLKRSRLTNYVYETSDELSAMKILNLR